MRRCQIFESEDGDRLEIIEHPSEGLVFKIHQDGILLPGDEVHALVKALGGFYATKQLSYMTTEDKEARARVKAEMRDAENRITDNAELTND